MLHAVPFEFSDYTAIIMPLLNIAPRVLGLHMALPMFSSASVPPQVQRSLSMSLALFLLPVAGHQAGPETALLTLLFLGLKEFFLGFAFGFPIALLISSVQGAGDIISTQSGASMASQFDAVSQAETSPIGKILMRFAEVLFFITGTYTFLLGALFDSYRIWPIDSFFPNLTTEGAAFFAAALGKYFAAACIMAFPAVACMFLITFCLALIGRYVPQLNVFFLAMPINGIAAIAVLILCVPIYAHLFNSHFRDIMENMVGLDKVFGIQ